MSDDKPLQTKPRKLPIRVIIKSIQGVLGMTAEAKTGKIDRLTQALIVMLRHKQDAPDAEYLPITETDLLADFGPINPYEQRLSARGRDLITMTTPYFETARNWDGVWTIGVGHTGISCKNDGTVFSGRSVTQVMAGRLLDWDIAKAEMIVSSVIRRPMTQDQFDAMVCFAREVDGFGESLCALNFNKNQIIDAGDSIGAMAGLQSKVNDRRYRQRRRSEWRLFNGDPDPVLPLNETP